ncbi:exoribonuclease II [Ferrimonas sp. SCSIO 43195]|uniref:exoribonuclease II n=1 Tax=Ferrimonas sp. SCSIO 43195 TaxID=2822844 RepID=UPI002074DCED|nr:exoribonuclease II [Ferrimonas sp. SCSIO 43195]USD37957.1 exoribonuclease II [Ferrimonas sp. SCSIO 43195]
MFQDNPLLQQLKAQIKETLPTVEGQVKATERGFGFLETDKGDSHFIPPAYMKKVVHGDRVSAVLRTEKDKPVAEPDQLLEVGLDRFIARVKFVKERLNVVPDHPLMREPMRAKCKGLKGSELSNGDYVVAQLVKHPLRPDEPHFQVEITELVAAHNDPHVPWWVVLAKHDLAKAEPADPQGWQTPGDSQRQDLTQLPFVTIDAESTKDMDDALYVEAREQGGWWLHVAIADPTAYVQAGDEVDVEARKRGFTQYLPGFNVPMLPRQLADELCSLVEGQQRYAVVARIPVASDGSAGDAEFSLATIASHAKLAYDKVSDRLEGQEGAWQPQDAVIAEQIDLLHQLAQARIDWREQHALVFPDRPDYRFEVDDQGNVVTIHVEPRRIANRIVEETMILANSAAAALLAERVGGGVFNVHAGLDSERVDAARQMLADNGLEFDGERLQTLAGYCELRRALDAQPDGYLDARLRRMQAFSEMAATPGAHYGMGLQGYATWTSPIRKYGDMVNHRLLKAVIQGGTPESLPDAALIDHLTAMRKLHRLCERDVGDWLFARYLAPKAGTDEVFVGEIIDINRGGVRLRLQENGAVVFLPAPLLTDDKSRLTLVGDQGLAQFDGEQVFRLSQSLEVVIHEVRVANRNIVVAPRHKLV